jgi:hypothetical protein
VALLAHTHQRRANTCSHIVPHKKALPCAHSLPATHRAAINMDQHDLGTAQCQVEVLLMCALVKGGRALRWDRAGAAWKATNSSSTRSSGVIGLQLVAAAAVVEGILVVLWRPCHGTTIVIWTCWRLAFCRTMHEGKSLLCCVRPGHAPAPMTGRQPRRRWCGP